MLLVDYVVSGGTVVYTAQFSSFVRPTDLEFMFKDAWGLQWRASAYTRETVTSNRFVQGLDVNLIEKKYSMKALFLEGVALKDAVYLESATIKKLGKVKSSEERLGVTFKTPAAFAAIGRGRVGYIGDVNTEAGTTDLVCAMCFHPGSYAPRAPGSGAPLPVRTYLSILRQWLILIDILPGFCLYHFSCIVASIDISDSRRSDCFAGEGWLDR